ncbi:putative reverse transcriptase domain-containing protein [Tanacetum coccineum]
MVLSNSTYMVGGPSTTEPELPFPIGRLFSMIVDSVVVHHEEIGGLSVRTKNLKHALRKLTIKTGKVSDAQVEDSIAIGEIRPKINTLEGEVEVLANQHDLMINKVVEVESHVLKMKDRVNAHPYDHVVGLGGDVDRFHYTACDNHDLSSSLIPLSRGSFDVIMGMDWLSKRKFVIVCHEKLVRIPLKGNEILQLHGERAQGVVNTLNEHKVEFRIDLVHGVTSVAKSPYHIAPLEMQELSKQLRELQDKGFIRPFRRDAPVSFVKKRSIGFI